MISAIQLITPIKQLKQTSFKSNIDTTSMPDSFEKSDETKLKEAIQKSEKAIVEHMAQDGREYGFLLSSNGSILDEKQGDENSCKLDLSKADNNCTAVHGHSKKNPLSPKDVATFLTSKSLKEIEAVSPDGQISRLTKTPETPSDFEYYAVLEETSRKYCLNILDALGIQYQENSEDFVELGKKFLQNNYINSTVKDEDVIPKLREIGIYQDDDLKSSYKNLYSALAIHDVNVYDDKAEEAIDENKDLIEEKAYTPLGIQAANDALVEIAQKYNLKYESNLE